MKSLARSAAAILMLLSAVLVHAAPPEARLNIPEFPGLEKRASGIVNVTLDSRLLGLAARFLDSSNPEDAAAKEVISGIAGIYVRSYTFDADFAYPTEEVERVRKQLTTSTWQQIVEARNPKERSYVNIHLCVDGAKACGLTIIASQPREFTIVNIVGAVDLEKLHHLKGKFGIPEIEIDTKPPQQKR